jgi:endoglucanase
MARVLAALLAVLTLAGVASAQPAPDRAALLRRGINVTNWFRFPADRDPAALRFYLGESEMRAIKDAGFTFVRLPVQPELLAAPGVLAVLAESVRRLERNGLAVIVALHPANWHLETNAADREALLATWRRLGPSLRALDPSVTFPELLNEPVFAGDPDAWSRLQHAALAVVRTSLPGSTVILTGADWGGVTGLLGLSPEADRNVIYSFHFYEPAELTALGAYRPGIDTAAMARLPFPVTDRSACGKLGESAGDPGTAGIIRFYCAQDWGPSMIAARIAQAGAWSQRNHAIVLAGEFGASRWLNGPARQAWLASVREACEQQGIGWALWGYDDVMGLALRPPGDRHGFDPLVSTALGLTERHTRK